MIILDFILHNITQCFLWLTILIFNCQSVLWCQHGKYNCNSVPITTNLVTISIIYYKKLLSIQTTKPWIQVTQKVKIVVTNDWTRSWNTVIIVPCFHLQRIRLQCVHLMLTKSWPCYLLLRIRPGTSAIILKESSQSSSYRKKSTH